MSRTASAGGTSPRRHDVIMLPARPRRILLAPLARRRPLAQALRDLDRPCSNITCIPTRSRLGIRHVPPAHPSVSPGSVRPTLGPSVRQIQSHLHQDGHAHRSSLARPTSSRPGHHHVLDDQPPRGFVRAFAVLPGSRKAELTGPTEMHITSHKPTSRSQSGKLPRRPYLANSYVTVAPVSI